MSSVMTSTSMQVIIKMVQAHDSKNHNTETFKFDHIRTVAMYK